MKIAAPVENPPSPVESSGGKPFCVTTSDELFGERGSFVGEIICWSDMVDGDGRFVIPEGSYALIYCEGPVMLRFEMREHNGFG